MTNPNPLPSMLSAVVGVIDPDAYAAGPYSTVYIDMSKREGIQALLLVGTMAATSTVDAKLEQATDAAGTGVKDITGKAIAQLTAAGTDSDKQAVINLRKEELDIANGFSHARLTVTVAVAASDMGAVVMSSAENYGPASDNDLASVDEIIA